MTQEEHKHELRELKKHPHLYIQWQQSGKSIEDWLDVGCIDMFSKIKLIALSVHNSKDVEYIAKHAMYRWGDDDFPMVRVAVAMHPLTPMNTLELMAADDNSEVISAIICNCKTSKRILKKIVQKNIPFWSKIAKTRLTIRSYYCDKCDYEKRVYKPIFKNRKQKRLYSVQYDGTSIFSSFLIRKKYSVVIRQYDR